MYSSYKKSDPNKCNFNTYSDSENEIPTATKTNYLEASLYMNTPSLKSPNRIHSKIQEVRDSIGSMINEMSHKKNENSEAILRVKNVNAEALNVYREQGN